MNKVNQIKLDFLESNRYYTLKQVKQHLYQDLEQSYCIAYNNDTGYTYMYDKLHISKITWPIKIAENIIFNIDERKFVLDDRSDEIFVTKNDIIEVIEKHKNIKPFNELVYYPVQSFNNVPSIMKTKQVKIPSLNTLIKRLITFDNRYKIIVSTNYYCKLLFKERYNIKITNEYEVTVIINNKQDKKFESYLKDSVFAFINNNADSHELSLLTKNQTNMQHKSQRLKLIDPVMFDFAESLLSGNRYTKICQKKFHPYIYTEDEATELKLVENKSVAKLPSLTKPDQYNWFKCDTKEAPYIGFISGEHPDNPDICLPCCRIRDPSDKPNQDSCRSTGLSSVHRNKNDKTNDIIKKVYTVDDYFVVPDVTLNSFLEQYGTYACYGSDEVNYSDSYILFNGGLNVDITNFNKDSKYTYLVYKSLYNIVLYNPKDNVFISKHTKTDNIINDIYKHYIEHNEDTAVDTDTCLLTYNQLKYLIKHNIDYSFDKKIITYKFTEIISPVYDDDSIIGAIVMFSYKKDNVLTKPSKLYIPLSYQKTDGPTNTLLKPLVDGISPHDAIIYTYNMSNVKQREWISCGDKVFALKYSTTNNKTHKYIYFNETLKTHEVFKQEPITNIGFNYYDAQYNVSKTYTPKPLNTKFVYYYNLYKLFKLHYNKVISTQRNNKVRKNIKLLQDTDFYLFEPAIYPYIINLDMSYTDGIKFLYCYQEDIDINDVQFEFDYSNIKVDDVVDFVDNDSFIKYDDTIDHNTICDVKSSPYYCSKKNKLLVPIANKSFIESIIDLEL